MKLNPAFALLTGMLILSGCRYGSGGPDPLADGGPPLTACTTPRPEICTQQYDPVCATRTDGSQRTYPNRCTACADADVTGTRPGPCD